MLFSSTTEISDAAKKYLEVQLMGPVLDYILATLRNLHDVKHGNLIVLYIHL